MTRVNLTIQTWRCPTGALASIRWLAITLVSAGKSQVLDTFTGLAIR